MTIVLDTSDIDVVNEAFNGMYSPMRLTALGAEPHVRITRKVLGDVELYRATFSMPFQAEVSPLGAFLFARMLKGTVRYESRDRSSTYGPDDIFLAARPDEPHVVVVDRPDVEFVLLTRDRINKAANAAAGRAVTPVRFTGYRPSSQDAARRWRHCFEFVRLTAATAAGNPLLIESLSGLLASTVLSAFPYNPVFDPTIEDRHDAYPSVVRRAAVFIEENAHRPIGTADIAAAANVSRRAVQSAFRRYLDTSPVDYLRRVRLGYAHQELRSADPADTATVAAVAARWGFTDHSRFNAAYQQLYGVAPSRTSTERHV